MEKEQCGLPSVGTKVWLHSTAVLFCTPPGRFCKVQVVVVDCEGAVQDAAATNVELGRFG